jgi:hypothetical protein
MGSTIVTLGASPNNQGVTSVSAFEEAFGEYSEARGRGRARRKKRRLERIANRKEVRSARREERKERKVGRQEVKQAAKQARIAKRAAAQADRQAKRTAAMQARQDRRFQRKELRLQRKALGDSPEAEMDDQTMLENGAGSVPRPIGPQDGGYSEPEQVDTGAGADTSADTSADTGYDTQQDAPAPAPRPQGSGVPQYTETELDGMNQGGYEDEGGYADEGYGDEGYGDDSYGDDSYGDEGYSEEGSGFAGDDDTDGIIALEDGYSELAVSKINPGVQQTANKVEWNKELISRLEDKKDENPAKSSEINSKIDNCMKRIAELELQLSKYQNFEGDFSSADGEFYEFSEARGRRKTSPEQKRGRLSEVVRAKKKAISERKSVQSDNSIKRKLKRSFPPAVAMRKFKQMKARRMAENGGDVTPVESDLNPEFSEQRIEIPAEETGTSSANGTGLNGLDLQRDFDAPRARYVELSSNAEGDQDKKVNWTSILLAVGIVGVTIWALRKYSK